MQNKEINEIFVFEDDQQINQQQTLQNKQNNQNKLENQFKSKNTQNTKQLNQQEQLYGMVSPSFQLGPPKNKQPTFITSDIPPPQQNKSKIPNLIFEQQNAYSFRKNELNFQTKKQQYEINQLQIISDFNSQISNNEALVGQPSKDTASNHNEIIKKNPSRRKFKDIYDQESLKSQKGIRRIQNSNDPQTIVPNILNVQREEQNNRTQDNFKGIQQGKLVKESSTMKRRRNNIKVPPLQNEKSGQIYINTSNIISNQSQMIAINKKEEDLRFANASSFTKMQSSEPQNIKTALKVLPQNRKLKCLFKRSKQCMLNYWHPQYSFYFSNMRFIANAKKQSCHLNSYYNITSSQRQFGKQNQNYLGHLQGNFVGSCFNLYQLIDNIQQLVCTICYESQLSCRLSTRSIEIYIKNQKFATSQLYRGNNGTKYNLKQLYSLGQNAQLKKIIKLVNKQPEWNQSLGAFIMNFRGKCKLPSVKNMILVEEDNIEKYNLLFCKIEQHQFHTQMMYPMSPFIAMGVVLSSFDFKICTQ